MTPLIRFHLATGVRLSLRASVPLAAVSAFLVEFSPIPSATLVGLASELASARGGFFTPTLLVIFCFGIGVWAAPRVALGLSGWLRHLPVDGPDLRRALVVALSVSQAPVFLCWVILWLGAWIYGLRADTVRLASLPLIHLGVAYVLMPVRHRRSSVVTGLIAVLLALAGSWILLAIAAFVLGAGDLMAGPPVYRRRARKKERWRIRSASWFPFRLAVRALGLRLAWAYIGSILCLVGMALFLSNNDLAANLEVAGVRLGGGFALSFLLFKLARLLSVRRPPWLWSRSLPWSATRRSIDDAIFMSLLSIPIVGVAILTRPSVGAPLLALTVYGSLRAAAALRSFPMGRIGESGLLLAELLLASLFLGLTGWTGCFLVAALPPAWRIAAQRERGLEASRWVERHHLVTGDPQSWSDA